MSGSRIAAIDVVRGVALLGILVVNLPAMTLPLVASGLPDRNDLLDVLAWIPIKLLFETKFMALFCLLFGIGVALQATRGTIGARFWRRMALLAVFGVTHAALLWSGDILLHYAVVGVFLPPLLRLSPARRGIAVAILLALPTLAVTLGHAALALDPSPPPPIPLDGGPAWLRAMASSGFDPRTPAFQAAERAVWASGDLADRLTLRAGTWLGFQALLLVTLKPLRTLGVFLLGAILWDDGVFRPDGAPVRRRLAAIGLGIGLPIEAAVIGLHVVAGFDEAHPVAAIAESVHAASGLLVGLGLLGGLATLAMHPRLAWMFAPFARAGRMALTLYLGQSAAGLVLVTLIGFGALHRAWHVPVAVAIVAGQAAAATWWLSRFGMGPLEWLWRAGTTLTLPPLRGPAT